MPPSSRAGTGLARERTFAWQVPAKSPPSQFMSESRAPRTARACLGPTTTFLSPASRRTTYSGSGCPDRKSVVEGKGVSVRVDLGGRRIHKKKKKTQQNIKK